MNTQGVQLTISEQVYRAYLKAMAALTRRVRPHRFNRWEKRLALHIPKSLLP